MGKARREKLVLTRSEKRDIKFRLWNISKKCGICGKDLPGLKRSSLDHIVPLGKGGKDVFENLQLAHWQCNNDKGDDYGE
tara:strand:- start:2957 stop:3196 length:240 start_codon:yes stop_codon:yes gene_type:complete